MGTAPVTAAAGAMGATAAAEAAAAVRQISPSSVAVAALAAIAAGPPAADKAATARPHMPAPAAHRHEVIPAAITAGAHDVASPAEASAATATATAMAV